MQCRPDCGACCIAPSITSLNKPAGVSCRHLTDDLRCRLFGLPQRPDACHDFKAAIEHCGENREQALIILHQLETETTPDNS